MLKIFTHQEAVRREYLAACQAGKLRDHHAFIINWEHSRLGLGSHDYSQFLEDLKIKVDIDFRQQVFSELVSK